MQYEYMHVYDNGPHGQGMDPEARVTMFNALGKEGWELISPPHFSGWYFKRKKWVA